MSGIEGIRDEIAQLNAEQSQLATKRSGLIEEQKEVREAIKTLEERLRGIGHEQSCADKRRDAISQQLTALRRAESVLIEHTEDTPVDVDPGPTVPDVPGVEPRPLVDRVFSELDESRHLPGEVITPPKQRVTQPTPPVTRARAQDRVREASAREGIGMRRIVVESRPQPPGKHAPRLWNTGDHGVDLEKLTPLWTERADALAMVIEDAGGTMGQRDMGEALGMLVDGFGRDDGSTISILVRILYAQGRLTWTGQMVENLASPIWKLNEGGQV